MAGHVTLRTPETLTSSQGLHFIDHRTEDMLPSSMLQTEVRWQQDGPAGAVWYETETPEGAVFGCRAEPRGQTIHVRFHVRNATGKPMDNVGHQQCLVLTAAEGLGRTSTLDTTYAWIDGRFTCLNTVTPTLEQARPDHGCPWIMVRHKAVATTYSGPMRHAHAWWVVDQIADEYLIVRISEDGKHLVAITWDESPHMLTTNTMIPCLHAGPIWPVNIPPGEQHTWTGRIYLMENDPPKLLRMHRKESAAR
jgi:hypothetical protein